MLTLCSWKDAYGDQFYFIAVSERDSMPQRVPEDMRWVMSQSPSTIPSDVSSDSESGSEAGLMDMEVTYTLNGEVLEFSDAFRRFVGSEMQGESLGDIFMKSFEYEEFLQKQLQVVEDMRSGGVQPPELLLGPYVLLKQGRRRRKRSQVRFRIAFAELAEYTLGGRKYPDEHCEVKATLMKEAARSDSNGTPSHMTRYRIGRGYSL